MHIALCYSHRIQQCVLSLEFSNVNLLIIGVCDRRFTEICQRKYVKATSYIINISEESIHHILMKVKAKARRIKLSLAKYILVFEIKFWFFGILHYFIRQLFSLSSFRVDSFVIKEFSQSMENSKWIIFHKYKFLFIVNFRFLAISKKLVFFFIQQDIISLPASRSLSFGLVSTKT